MGLKEILNFKLIDTTNYDLSIYNIVVVILIIVFARAILGLVKRIFKRIVKQGRIDLGSAHAIYQIIKYITWILVILLVLDTLGIKITIFLASSAALMVGLGLGLQQIFQDFVSGMTLLVEGSLKVNDIVQTNDGEVGKVTQIGMRTSKLETRDNIVLIVPNSKLINESLINWSHMENNTRFDVKFGVAYGSDVQLVEKLAMACALKHEDIEKDPKPSVHFSDFGDSSLDFKVLFYTNHTFRVEKIKSDIRFALDAAFRENNVTIPFPQRDVHFYDENRKKI